MSTDALDPLQAELFRPVLDQDFEARSEAGTTIQLRLLEVSEARTEHTEGFSLLLQGPKAPILPQGIHTLSHPALGQWQLFMVPVHSVASDGVHYQIIFNRMIRESSGRRL